jgi:hypothetical protein
MTWRCPACLTPVQHSRPDDALPRPGVVYRCHVCHLELEVDPETHKIRVAPIDWRAEPQSKKPGTHSE